MAAAGMSYGVRKKEENKYYVGVSGSITLGAILRRLKEMLN
jgi:hypothetical protein